MHWNLYSAKDNRMGKPEESLSPGQDPGAIDHLLPFCYGIGHCIDVFTW